MKTLHKLFLIFFVTCSVVACSDDKPAEMDDSWKKTTLCSQLSNTSWQLYSIVWYSENGIEVDRSDWVRPGIFTLTSEDYSDNDVSTTYWNGKIYAPLSFKVDGEYEGYWYIADNTLVTSKVIFWGQIHNVSSDQLQLILYYDEPIDGSAYQIEYYKRVDEPSNGSWGNGDSSNNSGTNENDINSIIKENVNISADYRDFTWYFTIESTLRNKLPGRNIVFGIGNGVVPEANLAYGNKNRPHLFYGDLPSFFYAEYDYAPGGVTYILFENNLFGYNVSQSGNKEVIKYEDPFYFYFWYGVDIREYDDYGNFNDNLYYYSDAAVHGRMYYATYRTLLDYPTLTPSEESLFKKMVEYMLPYEAEAKRYYHPSVYVKIDDKYYKIAEYKIN